MKLPTWADLPQVQPSAQPAPTIPERLPYGAHEAFGVSFGQEVERGIGSFANQYISDRASMARASARIELTDAESQMHQAFSKKMEEYGQKYGNDAYKMAPEIMNDLTKQAQDIGDKMKYPQSQSLFRARSGGILAGYSNHVWTRAANELDRAGMASLKSNQISSLGAIAASYSNDESVNKTAVAHETLIRDRAQTKGWSPDKLNEEINSFYGKVWETVANGYMGEHTTSGNQKAKEIISNHMAEMGEKGQHLMHLVNADEERRQATITAQEATDEYRRGPWVNEEAAADAVNKRTDLDPIVKDNAIKDIRRISTEHNNAHKQRGEQILDGALAAMEGGKPYESAKALLQDEKNGWGNYAETLRKAEWSKIREAKALPPSDAQDNLMESIKFWVQDNRGAVAQAKSPKEIYDRLIADDTVNPTHDVLPARYRDQVTHYMDMERNKAIHAGLHEEPSTAASKEIVAALHGADGLLSRSDRSTANWQNWAPEAQQMRGIIAKDVGVKEAEARAENKSFKNKYGMSITEYVQKNYISKVNVKNEGITVPIFGNLFGGNTEIFRIKALQEGKVGPPSILDDLPKDWIKQARTGYKTAKGREATDEEIMNIYKLTHNK